MFSAGARFRRFFCDLWHGVCCFMFSAGAGVTVSMTLPESIRALASDPQSVFILTNTNAATSTKTGAAATSGTACKGPTTYDSSTGQLSATSCPFGTYSLRVVKPASGSSGQVSSSSLHGGGWRAGWLLLTVLGPTDPLLHARHRASRPHEEIKTRLKVCPYIFRCPPPLGIPAPTLPPPSPAIPVRDVFAVQHPSGGRCVRGRRRPRSVRSGCRCGREAPQQCWGQEGQGGPGQGCASPQGAWRPVTAALHGIRATDCVRVLIACYALHAAGWHRLCVQPKTKTRRGSYDDSVSPAHHSQHRKHQGQQQHPTSTEGKCSVSLRQVSLKRVFFLPNIMMLMMHPWERLVREVCACCAGCSCSCVWVRGECLGHCRHIWCSHPIFWCTRACVRVPRCS